MGSLQRLRLPSSDITQSIFAHWQLEELDEKIKFSKRHAGKEITRTILIILLITSGDEYCQSMEKPEAYAVNLCPRLSSVIFELVNASTRL